MKKDSKDYYPSDKMLFNLSF
jgi:hypothetical protein